MAQAVVQQKCAYTTEKCCLPSTRVAETNNTKLVINGLAHSVPLHDKNDDKTRSRAMLFDKSGRDRSSKPFTSPQNELKVSRPWI